MTTLGWLDDDLKQNLSSILITFDDNLYKLLTSMFNINSVVALNRTGFSSYTRSP